MRVGITIGTGTSNFNIIAKHMDLAETQDIEFVELSFYDWNIICGRKIITSELDKLKSLCKKRKIKFTVHGELSVNFMDMENIKFHKEVLMRDIEITSSIGATHLVTHFGITTNENYNNIEKYNYLLEIQRESYNELGDYAKSHNVILAVENLYNFFNNKIHVPLPGIIADELGKINHSNVKATLDFSHAYINCRYYNTNFMNEITKMAPISNHLHVHDSFGILKNMYTYNESEDISYGLGDLHLPIGWGDIPFNEIFNNLTFPKHCMLNLEIQERFIDYFPETIKKARILSDNARIYNR